MDAHVGRLRNDSGDASVSFSDRSCFYHEPARAEFSAERLHKYLTTSTCFLLINIPFIPLKLLLSLAGGHAAHALWVVQKWMVREMWSMHVPWNGKCATKSVGRWTQKRNCRAARGRRHFCRLTSSWTIVSSLGNASTHSVGKKKKPSTWSYKMSSQNTEPWYKCNIPPNSSRTLSHRSFFF